MSDENPCALEKLAHVSRYLLVALFAAALAAGWMTGNPDRASAATPIGAAPNYLSCTVKIGNNSKFYITDTNSRTVCVYSLIGDSIRLVSVRKFDFDSRVMDSSLNAPVPADGKSLTRDDAKNYAKNSQSQVEAALKKIGQQLPEGE